MQISCCAESKEEQRLVQKEDSDGRRTFLDPRGNSELNWDGETELGTRVAVAAPPGSSAYRNGPMAKPVTVGLFK